VTTSPGPWDPRPSEPPRPAAGDGSAGTPLTVSVQLPATLQSSALARRFVRAVLHAWRFSDDGAYTAQLVVTELASNAVRHAAGRDSLELTLVLDGDTVTVGLCDGSAIPPVVAALTDDAESGRGMSIVNRVAEEWGHVARPEGKQIWARLRLARDGG
jgi:anti-sigma regulatory factor (Ser/Thr protein kinase)